jgi:hypothetical protein
MIAARDSILMRARRLFDNIGVPIHVPAAIVLPSLIAGAAYLAVTPLPTRSVVRVAGVMLLTAGATLALGGRSRDARRRWGAVFSLSVLLALMYPGVSAVLQVPRLSRWDQALAVIWLVVIPTAARLVFRLGDKGLAEFNRVLAVVVWMLGVSIWSFRWLPVLASSHAEWASTLATMTRPVPLASSSRPPDILHIVLDGMAGPHIARSRFGLDLSGQIEELEAEGVTVNPEAVANYSQTYLSLASVLNMQYLEGFATKTTRPADRWPLDRLIQESSVVRSLKQAGYEFTLVGSDYLATAEHEQADVCVCDPVRFGEFEAFALLLSPFRVFPIWSPAYEGHRRKLLQGFEAIERAPTSNRPQLLLAHFLAPHPPFVLGGKGPASDPSWPFGFHDGQRYGGARDAYVAGYRDQAGFVTARVAAAIREFIVRRGGRNVVVFLHGDHGPGLDFDGEAPLGTDVDQRMSILLATRWPRDVVIQPAVKSPVNLYRMLFRHVFGQPLETLADRSFVSPFSSPYDLTEVRPDVGPSPTGDRR